MKYTTFTTISIFCALIICGATAIQTRAAAGDLDTTFGSGGKVYIAPYVPIPTRVRVQPDGKIVIVAVDGFFAEETYIARYNADGSADGGFGNGFPQGGMTYLNLPNYIKDFIIAPDGNYFAIGYYGLVPNQNLSLYRINNVGILEWQVSWMGTPVSDGDRIALQPDGKIIAAGRTSGGFLLVRYNPDGTLDTGFGTNGNVIYGSNAGEFVNEVLLQPDGKIIIGGGLNSATAIIRFNPNGTLDTGFGTNGVVNTDIAESFYTGSVLQTDGKIVVNGRTLIKRYNPNGTPDISFGTNGTVGITNLDARTLVIQNNGKIIAAGSNSGKFALSRFQSNGAIDPSFGTNGLVITTFMPNSQFDYIRALTIQPDSKIIAAGEVSFGSGMARYLSESNKTNFDFDGDGRADISTFRPSDRTWYLNRSTQGFSAAQFGLATDKITPADFDGDGKTDISVYRDGVWYWLNSSNNQVGIRNFGLADDIPIPADFTGDGRAELAVYRGGTWWTLNLANNQVNTNQFGISTDKPVVADFDGDGRADQAVYRNGEWHLNRSSQGYTVVQFGLAMDKPVIGDYDGDGKTDVAVYRNGTWFVLQSSNGVTQFQFGISNDIPAPADYDGDGKTDAAVYRNGTWYLRQTTNGISVQQFGLANDKPVPAAYLP